MPLSSVPAAILAHMMAIENVPPPPLRSLPSLKMSRHIDYGQLNALCQMRGLQYNQSYCSILSSHNFFIKQYPKIFPQQKIRLPKLFKQEVNRKPTEGTEESQAQQPAEDSHNVAVYIKKARGGHTLYGPKKSEENFVEFLAILKKLPVHRTPSEHNTVWRTLRTIPNLTSQLSDEHLKILSKNIISETWVKGSTVIANDGFYIILKGLARPQTRVYKSLVEENESKASFIAQNYHSFVFDEDFKNSLLAGLRIPSCDSMLGQWSTFGTLEIISQTESIAKYAVVMEEDCEILRIPAKDCTKLKLEEKKLENKQKVKLIRQCPYYEEWPTLSIYELVGLIKWKKFPPGHELDPVTKQLMLQTAQPTFGHLTDEDVKNEYLQEEKQKEWENFKFWRLGNPRSRCHWIQFSVRALLLDCGLPPSQGILKRWREGELQSLLLLLRTRTAIRGAVENEPLMISDFKRNMESGACHNLTT
nr:cyclic nucleotide-binding domain-containing protein 1 isoform X10 [Equus asinus]